MAKAKVIWKSLAPPDDPRYKEPYAIVVQPSEAEIQQALAELKAEGKWPPKGKAK
jgi:hypothetical protein